MIVSEPNSIPTKCLHIVGFPRRRNSFQFPSKLKTFRYLREPLRSSLGTEHSSQRLSIDLENCLWNPYSELRVIQNGTRYPSRRYCQRRAECSAPRNGVSVAGSSPIEENVVTKVEYKRSPSGPEPGAPLFGDGMSCLAGTNPRRICSRSYARLAAFDGSGACNIGICVYIIHGR